MVCLLQRIRFAAILLMTCVSTQIAQGNVEWKAESFNDRAGQVLAVLGKQLVAPKKVDTDAPPLLVVLPSREERIEQSEYRVRRRKGDPRSINGIDALRNAWSQLFQPASLERVKFKVVGVELGVDQVKTDVLASLAGSSQDSRCEAVSQWRITWIDDIDGDTKQPLPRIQKIEIQEIELVEVDSPGGKAIFSDQTEALFRNTNSFRQQLQFGQAHWQRRIEVFHGILNASQNGASIADVNGDGWDDLYVCQPGGLPNRLYLQQADGTVVDATETWGVDLLDNSHAAIWADLDNDGDQDLLLTTSTALLAFENTGRRCELKGVFKQVQDAYSLAVADYDQNGYLDVYACGYFPTGADVESLPVPVPYFDARNGGRNVLLQNLGQWRFEDATASSGLGQDNRRFSYAAIWIDIDHDADQDLYVANDFGPDQLFLWNGQQFEEQGSEFGILHGAFGMSVTAGDVNRDGRDDLYVGNMYSSAGNRVTRQPEFRPGDSAAQRERFRRLAAGNSLYLNVNGQQLKEQAASAGVDMGRWSWGANFVDLNNDGWEDLLVSNGYITGEIPDDL